ncbi:MAG: lytic murein transglycosylase [Pseudomonadota bacterium]
MHISRRFVALASVALALSGCQIAGPVAATAPRNAWPARPNPAFSAWLQRFRSRARAAGLSETTINAGLRGVGYLPGVIERDRNQTEFKRSFEDYLAIAASDSRVSTGRAKFSEFGGLLRALEQRYGVPAQVICAIWGLESRYGARRGDAPVISALATLAFDGRRGAFFEKQLIAALKIIQNGDVSASRMLGSWAGAMGHTQFIPTSYEAFAVDYNGDGRRDIWSDDPTDALASAAAYLDRNGWSRGKPWGLEVVLPSGYNAPFGRSASISTAGLRNAGVRAARGGPLPELGDARVLIPSGRSGPAFAISSNFNAILRYNNSESYAIGIGFLSDRIAGGPPLVGRFGPDEFGLTKEDRTALQAGLNRAGFDAGEPDGVLGNKTATAIRGYQAANGLPVTGTPSPSLLARLK